MRRQRLLAHVPITAFAQSTRGARACTERCIEPKRRSHPPLRILCQFCGRLVHDRPARASARSARTEHDGLLFWKNFAQPVRPQLLPKSSIVALQRHVPSQALRRDTVSRLHRSRANDLRSSFVRRARACLVHSAGIVLYHDPVVIINNTSHHEQVCLCRHSSRLLRMHTLERSVQRFADTRYDSLVQVNSRLVRCLRREAHLRQL